MFTKCAQNGKKNNKKKATLYTKAKSLPMQIASSMATKDFDDYSKQAVFQPALHSRILQKKAALTRASLFVIQNDEFRFQSYNNRAVAAK